MTLKMTNLTVFCKKIQHANNQNKEIEQVACKAIKFDDDDGFANGLTANYANNCRVDYFEVIEQGLILIELKDIKEKIRHLLKNSKIKGNIQKDVLLNVENKFTDSLQIIQQQINSRLIPTINYLVVTNDTENNLLDRYLPRSFKERPFVICKTSEICGQLSKLNTRICQE